MERTVITLQSLLVLLATFHVATGCMCSQLNLDVEMCNPDVTVVRAKVIDAESQFIDNEIYDILTQQRERRSYRLQLQNLYKTGPNEIERNESVFKTASTIEESMCGFTLELGVDYLLIGTVNDMGDFSTNLCWLSPWEDLSESQVSLLEGTGPAPNCKGEDMSS
ncbi:hypothetical protein ACJMK2_032929 [Sinanodonta woodiana]|uniref:NTR domain-containing protein n=1 Tax=Sinanodonta woodiana TaxID=1069815 RepID=A0ABD3X396_SINWO